MLTGFLTNNWMVLIMKQIIFFIFSCFIFNSAFAEWQKFAETDTAVFYVDPNKRSKPESDSVVTIVFVIDYNTPQLLDGKVYMSSTYGVRFDCITSQMLPVLEIKNSGRRGSGDVISHIPLIDSWKNLSSSSIFHKLLNFACKK
jgi:hypothetical protein